MKKELRVEVLEATFSEKRVTVLRFPTPRGKSTQRPWLLSFLSEKRVKN